MATAALFKIKGKPVADRSTISASWGKRATEGDCDACKQPQVGRWVVACAVGSLHFRVCDNHAEALAQQLLALTIPHRRANPDNKERK